MDIEEAREFFSNDRFATENGITLEERDENQAVASLALAEHHRNAHGRLYVPSPDDFRLFFTDYAGL